MAPQVFAVPVFLVVFRETLETVIIVSVLLAWLKQTLDGPDAHSVRSYKRLRKQVWLGVGIGFSICLVVAAAVIGTFYTVGTDRWDGSEQYWEGAFALFASLIITLVGAALLRVNKMQDKWRLKLAAALEEPTTIIAGKRWRNKKKREESNAETGAVGPSPTATTSKRAWLKRFSEKYAMFVLPFITVLREGIEAIIFVAGVSFSAPASAFPLPAVVGLATGIFAGYLLYKGGSTSSMQIFLIASTCLIYLVAAGLFSRAVGYFEQQQWNNAVGSDISELGSGPGTYDISKAVWHVNCCSPEVNGGGGWGIFNAILGWNNTGTYGTVIAYNAYWIAVIIAFICMRYNEVKGHWPLVKAKTKSKDGTDGDQQQQLPSSSSQSGDASSADVQQVQYVHASSEKGGSADNTTDQGITMVAV